LSDDATELFFKRNRNVRFSTGSPKFDSLSGGGLPHSCITDIFGAAGTGKTQFAFQNALMTAHAMRDKDPGPRVIFVDCAGSFRPERIVEMAETRLLDSRKILEGITSVYVRSVNEQMAATDRIDSDPSFRKSRLVIVDDVTSNFVSDFSGEEEIAERQQTLSRYARHLSYIANKRGISVLFTNQIRSRGDLGEGESTGEALAPYVLFALRFYRKDRERYAEMVQPEFNRPLVRFEINEAGID
jgi:DNA repair protein RadA